VKKTPAAAAEKLIVIGGSTGGTEAIREVLERMPPDAPAILVAQHMPEGFTRSFAARLDAACRIEVKEATHDERILPGRAYIAPGHSHLRIKRRGGGYVTELCQGEPVNRHRPSVDVLFRSAACVAENVLAIILSGMGKDGAAGMLELHRAGAHTYAQDESSCVVYGMPKEAVGLGGVDEVLPLEAIAAAVLARLGHLRKTAEGQAASGPRR
jgi:two-component system chemotaxis response regulator CheB